MRSFYLFDHQGKGYPYARALEQAGWKRLDVPGDDIAAALYDHDVGDGGKGWRRGLDYLHGRNVPVMLYPHAARPMLQWDGMYPMWPHARLYIAPSIGHIEVMRAYGYPLPIEVCGWPFCEIKPWQPVHPQNRPVEVLFGPIHPNHNGWLHPVYRATNAILFQRLLETPGIKLTVRHIQRLEYNGLWRAPGVKYVLANPNGKTAEIDQADVVFGHQTFAFLAAARGKPVVMVGDDVTAHSGNTWENLVWAAHYDDYRDLMRYPIEAEAARNARELRGLIERAMSEDAGAAWRDKFIGQPLDPDYFVKTVERYL